MDLCFVDIETTGLDPTKHEIVEIAAIRVDGRSLECLCSAGTRIAPTRIQDADPEALKINGYSEPWRGSSLEHALELVSPLMIGAALAGHNVARFDLQFLEAAHRNVDLEMPRSKYIFDTAALLWPLLYRGEIDSLSLEAGCKHFGIKNNKAHSAMHDALASLELARALLGVAR